MSATDPVEQISAERHEHEVLTDLTSALRRLGALPPSTDTPYLTVSLDWRPKGTSPGMRDAPMEAWQEFSATLAASEKSDAARKSLTADVERITRYLREELDASAKGAFIVANSGQGVFEAEPLGLPIDTSTTIAPIPALKLLARLVEDHPLYAILQVDQRQAQLAFVSEDLVPATLSVTGSDYPRKQSQGGWSQRRFQARADERVEAFARVVAEETRKAMEAAGARRLILSAADVVRPPLMDDLHETVKEMIIGDIRIDIDAPFSEVMDEARPLAQDYERQREQETVTRVKDAEAAGGQGVIGAEAVLQALQNGQVRRLIMEGPYAEQGWADYTMPLVGVGDPPASHPAGGDVANIVKIPLAEEMIRQTIVTGAEIEIVMGYLPVDPDQPVPEAGTPAPRHEAAQMLREMGGVAALLRFSI